ncbi:MAG: PAS domain-containing protein, partial [Bacteroidia bacterium]|nr:PAS domain-containing protein [Bacteroidia bacterium]
NPLKRGNNSEQDIPKLTIDNQIYWIEIYNSSTGYPVKDVNGGSANGAMLIDSKGILWAGTGAEKTALVRMDYNAIHRNDKPPVVIIQNMKVHNENICWYNLQSSKEKDEREKVKGKSFKSKGADSLSVAPTFRSGVNKDSLNSQGFSPLTKEDSLAIINEEILTFGRTLSDHERDTMRYKFAGIKFDGITRFYPLPENLVLPYKHNNITFEFAAVEPARPYLVKYQYMLEGYDADWNPVTNKTSATFGNIWEGTYTFKIRALFTGPGCRDAMPGVSGNHGRKASPGVSGNQWSEPVVYTFKVLPPWYRTWWMYGAYALFLVAGCWLLVKWRERKLKREKQMLEQKVKERTAEVVQQKEELQSQKDAIEEKNEELHLQKNAIEEKNEELNQQKEELATSNQQLATLNNELEKLSIVASETDNVVLICEPDGTIEWVNAAFERMYEYTLEEYKKEKGGTLFESSTCAEIKTIVQKAVSEKSSVVYYSAFTKKNGELLSLQTTLTPVVGSSAVRDEMSADFPKYVKKLIVIDINITELRRMQQQLVESEKMASLGGLVAGVAHEINTPVGIGITAASSLDDKTKTLCEAYLSGKMTKSAMEAYFSDATAISRLILTNLIRTGDLIQ